MSSSLRHRAISDSRSHPLILTVWSLTCSLSRAICTFEFDRAIGLPSLPINPELNPTAFCAYLNSRSQIRIFICIADCSTESFLAWITKSAPSMYRFDEGWRAQCTSIIHFSDHQVFCLCLRSNFSFFFITIARPCLILSMCAFSLLFFPISFTAVTRNARSSAKSSSSARKPLHVAHLRPATAGKRRGLGSLTNSQSSLGSRTSRNSRLSCQSSSMTTMTTSTSTSSAASGTSLRSRRSNGPSSSDAALVKSSKNWWQPKYNPVFSYMTTINIIVTTILLEIDSDCLIWLSQSSAATERFCAQTCFVQSTNYTIVISLSNDSVSHNESVNNLFVLTQYWDVLWISWIRNFPLRADEFV